MDVLPRETPPTSLEATSRSEAPTQRRPSSAASIASAFCRGLFAASRLTEIEVEPKLDLARVFRAVSRGGDGGEGSRGAKIQRSWRREVRRVGEIENVSTELKCRALRGLPSFPNRDITAVEARTDDLLRWSPERCIAGFAHRRHDWRIRKRRGICPVLHRVGARIEANARHTQCIAP